MVAVVSRGGGTQGLLALVGRLQGSPRLAQLSVWLMGLVLFFDAGNRLLRVERGRLSDLVPVRERRPTDLRDQFGADATPETAPADD